MPEQTSRIIFEGDGPFWLLAQRARATPGSDGVSIGFKVNLPDRPNQGTLEMGLVHSEALSLLDSLRIAIEQSGSGSPDKENGA